jgi:hypothetical protein
MLLNAAAQRHHSEWILGLDVSIVPTIMRFSRRVTVTAKARYPLDIKELVRGRLNKETRP